MTINILSVLEHAERFIAELKKELTPESTLMPVEQMELVDASEILTEQEPEGIDEEYRELCDQMYYDYEKFINEVAENEPPLQPFKKPRKAKMTGYKRDTRKLTLKQYDFVLAAYERRKEYNKGKPRAKQQSIEELVVAINSHLKLNKSQRYYSRIWGKSASKDRIHRDDPNHIIDAEGYYA